MNYFLCWLIANWLASFIAHTNLAVFQVYMAVCLSHGKKEFSFTTNAIEEQNIQQTRDKEARGNWFYKTISSVPWTQWLRSLMIRTNQSLIHSTNIYLASFMCLDQWSVADYKGEQKRLSDTWRAKTHLGMPKESKKTQPQV